MRTLHTMDPKSPAPTLTLCASSKESIQAPLALAKHLAGLPSSKDAGLPVNVEWTSDASHPITLTLQPGGEKKSSLQVVVQQLADMYASLGMSGKDSEESKEVSAEAGS